MNDLRTYQLMQHGLVSSQARVDSKEDWPYGLCSFMQSTVNALPNVTYLDWQNVNNAMQRLMQQWPEWSGCDLYIIGQNPEDARRLYIHGHDINPELSEAEWKWAKTSPYGRKRRELLAYLISRCEEITGQVL